MAYGLLFGNKNYQLFYQIKTTQGCISIIYSTTAKSMVCFSTSLQYEAVDNLDNDNGSF